MVLVDRRAVVVVSVVAIQTNVDVQRGDLPRGQDEDPSAESRVRVAQKECA